MLQSTEYHPLYGEIRITINPRARRIILRAREGFIEVTLPPSATRKDFDNAVAKHGERLAQLSREALPTLIDGGYRFDCEGFRFALLSGKGSRFLIRYNGCAATLIYPETTDFSDAAMQQWLRKVRVAALRRVAGDYLPTRLTMLARKYKFDYSGVTLRGSHTRWGSCSNRKSISLSVYLQLLPSQLADYVMLHELCHTVEMNHGPRFWQLMDSVTNGKARQLRSELKNYKPDFP